MKTFLAALVLFGNFSLRTPNKTPNPADYQIAGGVKIEDTLYIENQYERENGDYYYEEIYEVVKEFKSLYLRERYLYKRSKSMRYNQIDLRYKYKYFSAGYALRHTGKNLVPGHNIVIGIDIPDYKSGDFTVMSEANLTGNDEGVQGIQVETKLQYDKFYCDLDYEKQGSKSDFSVITGFEVSINFP